MKRIVLVLFTVALLGAIGFGLVRSRQNQKAAAKLDPPEAQTTETTGAQAPSVDDSMATRGSIAGRVTNPSNAGVAADVCAFASSDKLVSKSTRTPFCTKTNADGTYRIADLAPATYEVSATAPQHQPVKWRDRQRERTGFELHAGESREHIDLVLTPGGVEVRGRVKDISGGVIPGAIVTISSGSQWDARSSSVVQSNGQGEFQGWTAEGSVAVKAIADGYNQGTKLGIAPGQVIEVTLTPESVLQGRVVEIGTETPVPNARVTALAETPGWMSNAANGSALTDDEGRFRITGLDPGRYKPEATSPHRWGTARESVLLGLAETSREVVIEVHPALAIAGRVEPCTDGGSVWIAERGGADRKQRRIDDDGHVRFEGVMPGTYNIDVFCRNAAKEDKYEPVKVTDKDVTGLVWKVGAGLSVTGVVVDGNGTPVADANISARSKGGDPRANVAWGGSKSAADGTFKIRGLKPGNYTVEAYLDSWGGMKNPPEVKVDRDVANVRIVLANGRIEGTVTDATGAPAGGMQVRALGQNFASGGETTTRDDGTFVMKNVHAGDYHVRAEMGWSAVRAPNTKDDDVQGVPVSIKGTESVKVKLVVETQKSEIHGRVVGQDGQPVSDAFVSAERESDSVVAQQGQARRALQWQSQWSMGKSPVLTDTDGNFTISKLSPGSYTVRAFRKGGGEAVAEKVTAGTKVTITIKNEGSLAGTLAPKNGALPERFTVGVRDDKTGVSRRETFFRTSGTWTLRDLPEGDYHLSADSPEGRGLTRVALAQGEKKEGIQIEIESNGSIKGQLVSLEGNTPVPAMYVLSRPAKGDSSNMITSADLDRKYLSDAQGRFEIERVAAGKVSLIVMPRDMKDSEYAYAFVPVTVQAGKPTELPPIRLAKARAKGGLAGDLGYAIQPAEPGADLEQRINLVKLVTAGGAAAKAGLTVGDEITTVDGHDVTGVNAYLYDGLSHVPEGQSITLGLKRGSTVVVTAGKPRPRW